MAYQNIYYHRDKNLIYLWDDTLGLRSFPYTRYAYEKCANGEYKTLYGDRVTKIYKFKKDDGGLFESDVPETTRVLVDIYTESDLPSEGHVVLTYDIEVEMKSGLPDVNIANNEITSIAMHDASTNKYWVLIVDKEYKVKQGKTDRATVIRTDTEKELLLKFLDLYERIKPTILTGWNIDYFDTPYLYNRLKKLFGAPVANRLSPIGQCFFSPYRNRYFMAGVSCLDYLALYKNFTYSELDSYRLDSIAELELGRKKVEYSGNLDTLMETDIDKFIEYNLVDVELVVEFDKKLQFIDIARGICHAGHVPYEDFVYSSKYLEGALLCYLKRMEIVAPNKPLGNDDDESGKDDKFAGAYVKEPIVGKYEWIYDLDLTSLYPSIIMSLNISPETKMGKIENWNAQDFIKNKRDSWVINGSTITNDNLIKFLQDSKFSVASNGVLYRTDKIGCIPDILNLWFNQRVEFRKLEKQYGKAGDTDNYTFYKKRQLVQKILLNSLYGCLGLPKFRFYDIDNAEAVTLTGRTVIQTTSQMANIKYNKELGGDAILIKLEDDTEIIRYPNSKISVNRGGVIVEVLAKDLSEGDDIIL